MSGWGTETIDCHLRLSRLAQARIHSFKYVAHILPLDEKYAQLRKKASNIHLPIMRQVVILRIYSSIRPLIYYPRASFDTFEVTRPYLV